MDPAESPPVLAFLPAHDEAASVADVVRRFPPRIGAHPVQVLVIDDGSGDHTAACALAAGAEVHSFASNRGLGAAVRAGLMEGTRRGAVAVAFLDADGEYAPEELGAVVAPILAGRADYVVGSRFAGASRSMRAHRVVGNRMLTMLVRLLVRRHGWRGVTDGQSGYRALSPAATAAADIAHDFNYAQVLTVDLAAKGFRYAEVPITYAFRRHGRSFVRPVPYLRAVLPTLARQRLQGAGNDTGLVPGATTGTDPGAQSATT